MAPAGIGAEAFASQPAKAGEVRATTEAFTNETAAKALEALAKELRRGSIDSIKLRLASEMAHDTIADCHTLTFDFLFKPEI